MQPSLLFFIFLQLFLTTYQLHLLDWLITKFIQMKCECLVSKLSSNYNFQAQALACLPYACRSLPTPWCSSSHLLNSLTPVSSTLEHSGTPLLKQDILFTINHYELYLQTDPEHNPTLSRHCSYPDEDHLSCAPRRPHWANKSLDGFPPCSSLLTFSLPAFHSLPHSGILTVPLTPKASRVFYLCLCLRDSLCLQWPCLDSQLASLLQISFQIFLSSFWGGSHFMTILGQLYSVALPISSSLYLIFLHRSFLRLKSKWSPLRG